MALIFGSAIVSYPSPRARDDPFSRSTSPQQLQLSSLFLESRSRTPSSDAARSASFALALAPGSDTRCCDRVSSVLVRRFVILRAPAVAEAVVVAYASFTARRNSFVTNSRGHACHGCRVGVVVVVVLDNICEELFWSVVQWSQKFVTRILNYVILM